MTPKQALDRIDKYADGIQEIINGLCRIPTLHPDAYPNVIKNGELYHKLLDMDYKLKSLWDYIHKNEDKLV